MRMKMMMEKRRMATRIEKKTTQSSGRIMLEAIRVDSVLAEDWERLTFTVSFSSVEAI